MNLILVDEARDLLTWPWDDPRACHVREVLRMKPGDSFFIGVPNGPLGKARWLTSDADTPATQMQLAVTWEHSPTPAPPLILLVGLPRPQTARRILFEAAVFGIRELAFFQSTRGEPSYAQSSLWSSDEWQRILHRGAEQAFATTLPEVSHHDSLGKALASITTPTDWDRLALDVYEAEGSLSSLLQGTGAILALGAERGWAPGERHTLREADYQLAGLGNRVLRTETACVAALSLSLAHLGTM